VTFSFSYGSKSQRWMCSGHRCSIRSDLPNAGQKAVTNYQSGIGRATAIAFARDGCFKLYLGDLSVDGLEVTRTMIKSSNPEAEVEIERVDISDEGLVIKFYESVVAKFGRIDFAANIAGYAHAASPIASLDSKMYDMSYNINQRGVR
jgi:NAD(P)-dependent dehydrogenase (short-subunit alcohol dehydrogenase family)